MASYLRERGGNINVVRESGRRGSDCAVIDLFAKH
jgi:hypothetical protein